MQFYNPVTVSPMSYVPAKMLMVAGVEPPMHPMFLAPASRTSMTAVMRQVYQHTIYAAVPSHVRPQPLGVIPVRSTFPRACKAPPIPVTQKMPMTAPPPQYRATSIGHPLAQKPQKSVGRTCRTDSGPKKPIVILVSVKDVEAPCDVKSIQISTKRRQTLCLRRQVEKQLLEQNVATKFNAKCEEVKFCAMDAEMVGAGSDGKSSVLARISIVDFEGKVLFDSLVQPDEPVTDYRTFVTGIEKGDLDDAPTFSEVRISVIDIIRDKVVIGHALENDFKVLGITHPADMIRDTAYVKSLRQKLNRPSHLLPSLKSLVSSCLPSDFAFRKGKAHDPIEDARAPLELFKRFRKEFETQISDGSWTCSPSFYDVV